MYLHYCAFPDPGVRITNSNAVHHQECRENVSLHLKGTMHCKHKIIIRSIGK